VDHFTWSIIPSPQFVDSSFAVTINVLDAFDSPVTNFNGAATLSGAGNHGAVSLTPSTTGSFTAGQWTGTLAVNTLDTTLFLQLRMETATPAPAIHLHGWSGKHFYSSRQSHGHGADSARGLLTSPPAIKFFATI